MPFGPHRARNGMAFKSAEQAFQAGYQIVYSILHGGINDLATYLSSVEAQCEQQKSNTLVPFVCDYWRGQVCHLREHLATQTV